MRSYLLVILTVALSSFLTVKAAKFMQVVTKPIVQIVNLTTGVRDEIPYQEWLDISRESTELPVSQPYIRHLTWGKCRKIDGILVESFKSMSPGITIFYRDVCK